MDVIGLHSLQPSLPAIPKLRFCVIFFNDGIATKSIVDDPNADGMDVVSRLCSYRLDCLMLLSDLAYLHSCGITHRNTKPQRLSIECWVRACSSSDATSAIFILRIVCERPGDLVLNTTHPLGDINNAKEFSQQTNTFQNIGAPYPRYRFRQDDLIFLNTFTGVRNRSGWILPTAAKILVNVKQTEDAGTWSGQVEGSKERGMFLSSSVEPM